MLDQALNRNDKRLVHLVADNFSLPHFAAVTGAVGTGNFDIGHAVLPSFR
jgi:hypothetical protein